MAKKKITVTWSKAASSHFAEILEYLHSESPSAASIVANTILSLVENYLPIRRHIHQIASAKINRLISEPSLF
ncbi:MAG: hypothetical protein M3R17_01435 [Bacteroidota bacterium]|nr:hypothetical protein [Bacteroidota bacterium]